MITDFLVALYVVWLHQVTILIPAAPEIMANLGQQIGFFADWWHHWMGVMDYLFQTGFAIRLWLSYAVAELAYFAINLLLKIIDKIGGAAGPAAMAVAA